MKENPLGTEPIGKLLLKFAIPTIASSLVNAAYNITDQVFIGWGVGYLGNAATNIAFPLSTLVTAVAILLGIGAASNFNLYLGAGEKEDAAHVAGNGILLMLVFGFVLGIVSFLFIEPMMMAFGATESILPYAVAYTRIIALGIPFTLFSSACSTLIRADGSPAYSMITIASGAVLNIILDPLFIFTFDMGIVGAAYATIISQFVTFVLAAAYIFRFKNIKITLAHLHLRIKSLLEIAKLGIPGFLNLFMMMIVQIVMNNILRTYGPTSIYGGDIPLAVMGIVVKVNVIVVAFTVGLSQGCQPIFGFNYGAKQYGRVKDTYKTALGVTLIFSVIAFLAFQLFPRQIVGIFGHGDELYFQFAEYIMRIYLFMVFLFGVQPLTAGFFTSIGKAYRGLFITITRQGLFLLPLLFLMPRVFGFESIAYAGPISDGVAVLVTAVFVMREFRELNALEAAK